MGRPIKKEFIKTTSKNYIECTAWPVGASGPVTCTILKQRTNNRFKVTDGTHTSVCKLVTGASPTVGQMSITVNPDITPLTQATFSVKMVVSHATLVGIGSGYVVNDVLTVSGGTFSPSAATITVNTVNGSGGILTYTLTTGGTYTALPANPVATTDSPTNGTGATFNLTYGVLNFSVTSGGTGYGANTTVQFVGGGYATLATGTVVVSGGVVGTPVIVTAGSGYTSIPTVLADSVGATEYISKLNNRTVSTFTDHKYMWYFGSQGKVNTGLVGDLKYALIQSNPQN